MHISLQYKCQTVWSLFILYFVKPLNHVQKKYVPKIFRLLFSPGFSMVLLGNRVQTKFPGSFTDRLNSFVIFSWSEIYGKSELCKNHEFSNKLIQLMKRRTTRDKSRKKSNETCLLFIDVAKNDLLALKFGTNVVVVMIYLSSPRTKQTTRNWSNDLRFRRKF